ncbi:hypothetical protein [Pseudomonas sp. UBA6310]|uniref:hypothetical protein n=1 Tax=Pseudomonas sp. UBA6310 TaxID=1947327 RepID=UPI0025808FBA|nr:hypothetical protein [Pseudomonas sp. UBA6310]
MRSGNLNTPAHILELDADLNAITLDWVWCGIQTKESGDFAYPSGLRNPAKVTIRAWYDERLKQGRYLCADQRLFHIDSTRDFSGNRAELAITATEFIGQPALYLPAGRPQKCCRVFINHDAQHRDDMGQATGYRTKVEALLIETGRVQVDDRLQLNGVDYLVIDYADDSDDGIVRAMWLERI